MRKKWLIILGIIISLLLIVYLVNLKWVAPKKAVKVAVEHYNLVYEKAMAEVKPDAMLQVATLEGAQRTELEMMYLGQQNRYLDAEMHDLKLLDISVNGTTAVARTEENWTYREMNYKTRQLISEKKVNFLNTYSLEKKQGKWLVSKANKYLQ